MSSPPLDAALPSAQVVADGQPRFFVPPAPGDPAWPIAAEVEAAGGVAAGTRAFLDAQLEGGDLLVDLAPGFGFVALSATTAPGGMPTVFVGPMASEEFDRLQDAALDVGGWLEPVEDRATIVDAVIDRLEGEGRVFLHVGMHDLGAVLASFAPLHATGRLVAVCIDDVGRADFDALIATCTGAGFTPAVLAERDGELILVPAARETVEGASVIALPQALLSGDAADEPPHDAHGQPATPASAEWRAGADGFTFLAPHARTGYGIAAASLLQALQRRGQPVALVPLGAFDPRVVADADPQPALDAQAHVTEAWPSVRFSQQFDLTEHVGDRARLGFTIFERDAFTDGELAQLNAQDAVIVCSEWARAVCLAAGVRVPVHVVPLGVDRSVFHERVAPVEPRGDDTVFLQVGKLEPRKGQRELLRAFEEAFSPTDPVRLVLHCRNPFVDPVRHAAALAPFRASVMAPRITILDDELPTQHDVARLMAGADCGVFAVRAEGWNLEALEMLSMGRHVIASDCTGHTAYLTADNARLIAIDALEPAGAGLAGRWAAWGERQHAQLVSHLRAVHAARQAGTLARNDAGIATAERFTWDASATALVDVIARVTNGR